MFQSPPVREWPSFPVTSAVIAAAIVATVFCWITGDFDRFSMDFRAWHGEPWRLLSSALPHVDPLHLAFNGVWLWIFGTRVERVLGSLPTALLIVLFAVGSAAAEYMLFSGGVGLSGVGYGFFGLLWTLNRGDPRFAGAMDRSTVVLFAGWFVFCCLLTAMKVMRIGNAAHAAGALFGVLAGIAIATRRRKWLARAAVLAATAAVLLGATIGRPYVHLGPIDAADIEWIAHRHIQAKRYESAVRLYRRAAEIEPGYASHWFNLGVALQHAGDNEASLDAYEKAASLDPGVGGVASEMATAIAYQQGEKGNSAEAIKLYEKAVRLNDRNETAWFNLGVECQRAGKFNRAAEAFRRAVELNPSQRNREALAGAEQVY